MNRQHSPKAPGYSADAPPASVFALAEPDYAPLEGPTRTRWALDDTGALVETPETRLRSKPS